MNNAECLSALDRYEFDRIVKVLDDLASVDDMNLNDVRQALAYIEHKLDYIYDDLFDKIYDFDEYDLPRLHKLLSRRFKSAKANRKKLLAAVKRYLRE